MGQLTTAPSTFVANTRARAAEVNAKFSAHNQALKGGVNDLYATGYRINRLSPDAVNTTITGNDCFMCAFYTLETSTTFDLATSTARLACIGDFTISTNATLHIATNAVAKIV